MGRSREKKNSPDTPAEPVRGLQGQGVPDKEAKQEISDEAKRLAGAKIQARSIFDILDSNFNPQAIDFGLFGPIQRPKNPAMTNSELVDTVIVGNNIDFIGSPAPKPDLTDINRGITQ